MRQTFFCLDCGKELNSGVSEFPACHSKRIERCPLRETDFVLKAIDLIICWELSSLILAPLCILKYTFKTWALEAFRDENFRRFRLYHILYCLMLFVSILVIVFECSRLVQETLL